MFPCPTCGNMVAPQAFACPRCGQPFQRLPLPPQGPPVDQRVATSAVRVVGCLLIFVAFLLGVVGVFTLNFVAMAIAGALVVGGIVMAAVKS